MTVKNPKCLAIDTSVMLAASGHDNSSGSEGKACRDFMKEMLKTGHLILMTDEITQEWDKYGLREKTFTPATLPWYVIMRRRGQVRIQPGNTVQDELRDAIFKAVDPNAIEAVRKDMRWIEGALLADRTVASNERKIRGHFRRAAQQIEEIKTIVWVNPISEEEACVIWLREGAPADEARMLGYSVD